MENGSQKNEIIVRHTGEQDIPLIMDLVRSLAEFEGLADHVLSTEETLREALFGERTYAEAIVAEVNGKPAGFIMFFHNFSSFVGKPGLYIEDIFVHSEFRGMGVGKALMVRCGQIAQERDCGRMEWSVLDWNPARKFYEHFGGELQKEWLIYRLDKNGIKELAEKK
ncbi:GNAT family N-acetyltransferase [Methanolobus profundi]|uniref:Acetyltransferase (GNAT) family protein n=1 Tax=Methanolobus profundi TaxID=487685 RepID=A0A1I4P307_9EURY|nr:GNAT family N-acetyltransferase [Methanolobus profundi]SFM21910.1 Acetyltransferase (GNAT) family protein [Methanolobus profundi]